LVADASTSSGSDVSACPWWTVRLALHDRDRRYNGACGGQQTVRVADPQHPGDCLTGY
jgi:hypothetical protein